jgi:hypothetical protein
VGRRACQDLPPHARPAALLASRSPSRPSCCRPRSATSSFCLGVRCRPVRRERAACLVRDPRAGARGLVVAPAVRLPGHGGHTPLEGIGIGEVRPADLPSILLAPHARLRLGPLGPEAPLVALSPCPVAIGRLFTPGLVSTPHMLSPRGAITSRIAPRAGDDGGRDRSRRATRGRALPARSVQRKRPRR